MNEPNLDDLSLLVPSKFSLVTLAMKRARQLKAGSRPLIDTYSHKPVTIALQEILSETVRLGPSPPADELEKEEQEAMFRAIGLSEPTSVSVTRRMEEIFGRGDEEIESEYDEYDEEYEEEREDEEEEADVEKDVLESDEEEEEEGLVGAPRRGADFLTDDGEAATPVIEDDDLEIEIEDDDDDDDDEDSDDEEEVAEAGEEGGDEAAEQPAKGKGKAKAAEKPAAATKAPAKSAKAKKGDDEDEPAAKKSPKKPKA